ncbi:hypothetical protein QFC19_008204 [Naganishia cerealis]|uniref:Uncharacterized protein n=1 Tax=Naganishia cerealis TaxID=610337 RepID=A0ACC2V4E2_9TREE|nr:hypothetical protein QFC19_008204 [Naganishia cerealis]
MDIPDTTGIEQYPFRQASHSPSPKDGTQGRTRINMRRNPDIPLPSERDQILLLQDGQHPRHLVDNFYVGVARALHPALRGLPVGITQKSLLATVSYEARALGLGKLQNIREATDVVNALGGQVVALDQLASLQQPSSPRTPVLVLVSGEDLTPFRRASRAVSWIVNTLLGVGPAPHPPRLAPVSATLPPPAETRKKRKREGHDGRTERNRERHDDHTERNRERHDERNRERVTPDPSPSPETHIARPPSTGGCEKLGLDEVFIDITALVDAHLACPAITNERGETFFRLPTSAMNVLSLPNTLRQSSFDSPVECGFWYPQTLTGHPIPHAPPTTRPQRTLIVASHLCAFLRRVIWEKTSLTSSGGVAGSKMLAKLITSAKKPDGQSFWVDDDGDGSALETAEKQSSAVRPVLKSLQDYLDPLPLSALPGFGTHIISSLMAALPPPPSHLADSHKSKEITVHRIRTSIPLSIFTRLFPGPQATTLYNLLHGYDPSPVRPTPEYPLQLSVEDSYAATLTRPLRVILAQMLQLVKKLLDRLEEELIGSASERYSNGITFSDPPPPSSSSSITPTRPAWQRYPTQFRVTLRTFTDTHSQSAPMPAFIFDTGVPTRDRAERVMRTVGKRLCYALLPGKIETEAQSFKVYVDSPVRFSPTAIYRFSPPSSSRRRPTFDLSFIAALPPEMRKEVIEEYRIPQEDVQRIMAKQQEEIIEITDSDDESSSGSRALTESVPRLESQPCEGSVIRRVETMEDNSSEVAGDEDLCRLCGAQVFAFAAQAHARWHAQHE